MTSLTRRTEAHQLRVEILNLMFSHLVFWTPNEHPGTIKYFDTCRGCVTWLAMEWASLSWYIQRVEYITSISNERD